MRSSVNQPHQEVIHIKPDTVQGTRTNTLQVQAQQVLVGGVQLSGAQVDQAGGEVAGGGR